MSTFLSKSLLATTALASFTFAAPIQAQINSVDLPDELVVTGVRGIPRSVLDSPVAVDTFDQDAIEAVAFSDMNDILQTLVPSFNIGREPSSDGATFIRPLELRGLPAHHTLLLVDGKRRHRSALVGDRDAGVHGPDPATIPAIAIKSIEVLRDGASALYGSDAIAGVINVRLKDSSDGGLVRAEVGQHYEGDGRSATISGNIGLPIGPNGFVSVSAEFNNTQATERSVPFCRAGRFCLDPSDERFASTSANAQGYVLGRPNAPTAYERALQANFPASVPLATTVESKNVVPWGQPNSTSTRFFVNAGLDLADNTELYGFGNYSHSNADGTFAYRFPGIAETRLVRRRNGNLYSVTEDFPGGFTPRFFGEVVDWSALMGVRGQIGDSFNWDLSGRHGQSEIGFEITQTYNPSLGPDSPKNFNPGSLQNEETQVQADFTYDLSGFGFSGAVFAFGASYLDERYEIKAGDPASFAVGPYINSDPFGLCTGITRTGSVPVTDILNCANSSDPVYNKLQSVGSNGFPGYSSRFADTYKRDSWAVYGEVSGNLTNWVFVQAAARHESYSDFGSETVGKFAALVNLSDWFALRGSIGSGFRAPTPGQQGTTKVSTDLPFGEPVAVGLFPAGGPVGVALGAKPLKAETSVTLTGGFTAQFGRLKLTADYYDITIDDAFSQVSTLPVSSDPTRGAAYQQYLALTAAGVDGAAGIGGVFYYQNLIEIGSKGFDVVASYPLAWGQNQLTDLQFSLSYNKVKILDDPAETLGFEDRFDFENFNPNLRFTFVANHRFSDKFSVLGRASYYGNYANGNNNLDQVQEYAGKVFIDLEASLKVTDDIRIGVGGRNIFDEYPDKVDFRQTNDDTHSGRLYESQGKLPWQGGFYYVRASVTF